MNKKNRKVLLIISVIIFLITYSIVFYNLLLVGEEGLNEIRNDTLQLRALFLRNCVLGIELYSIGHFISKEKKGIKRIFLICGFVISVSSILVVLFLSIPGF